MCAARAKRLRTPCRCVISCTARQQVCRRNAGIKFGPNPSEIKTETSCSEGSTVAHAALPDGYLSVLISDFVFLCIQRQRGNFANASSCFKLVSDGLCSFRKRVELMHGTLECALMYTGFQHWRWGLSAHAVGGVGFGVQMSVDRKLALRGRRCVVPRLSCINFSRWIEEVSELCRPVASNR